MTTWYIARGAGLSALVLLSVATCLGVAGSGRGAITRRWVLQYVHRAAAGLGLAVLVLHVATIVVDEYANVGLTGALVPFTSGYRPGWVALGTFAAYTFLAVAVLGAARGRMAASPVGARIWRGLHGLSYVAWAAAMLHGFNAGTDTQATWVRVLYAVCGVAVFGAMFVRLGARNHESPRTASRFTIAEGVSR